MLKLWPSSRCQSRVLGMVWLSHHRIFHYIKQANPMLIWINILFLMFIALVPFSTRLMADYLWQQVPFVVYGINLFLALILRLALWNYASGKSRLVDSSINPIVIKRLKLFIGIVPPTMFLVMIGVSFLNTIAGWVILWLLIPYGVLSQRLVGSE